MPNPLDLSVLSDLENFSDLDSAQSQSKDDSPFRLLPWDKIEEDPDQPRTHMDETALQELADSMKQKGQVNFKFTLRLFCLWYHKIFCNDTDFILEPIS